MSTTETHGTKPPAPLHPNRWKMLGVMCLALVVTGFDSLIVTVALPSIQSSIGASNEALQWVVGAYALAFAAPLFFAGGLVDRYGRRVGFLLGMALMLAGSVIAAFAGTVWALLLGRVVMGVGAAFIMPATLALIRHVFPEAERAKAMGIWAGVAALGVPLGPILGGLLLQRFEWGSIFLINIPIILVAIIACLYYIPETKDRHHPGLDYPGFLLSVFGLVAVVDAIIEAPERGWMSPLTIALMVGGLALIIAFIWWENRSRTPLLDPTAFKQRGFGAPLLTISSFTFAMYGTLFGTMMYLQFGLGYGPFQAGLHLLAMCTMLISAPMAAQLPARYGLGPVSAVGLVLVAASLLILGIGLAPGSLRVVVAIAVLGIGAGLTTAPSTNSVVAHAPERQAGAGSAAADVAFQLGGALGIAVLGSIITTLYRSGFKPTDELGADTVEQARASLGAAVAQAERVTDPSHADLLMQAARSSFEQAFSTSMIVGAIVCLAGAAAIAALLPRQRQESATEPTAMTG